MTRPATLSQILDWRAPTGAFTAAFALLNGTCLIWLALLQFSSPVQGRLTIAGIATELIAGACLLAYRYKRSLQAGATLACLAYLAKLLHLFTESAWLADMGGFPFLGAGQGTIKYVPMLATSLYLLVQASADPRQGEQRVFHVAWIGVVLVMGWIGCMKFFLFEAEGIEPLLRNHLAFSWMYRFWGVQGVSNIIGAVELLFALAIMLGLLWERLMVLAMIGISVTVACTISFMFTLPGWSPDAYFPILNRSGIFLLKDLFLLAAMLLVFSHRPPRTPTIHSS
jgi:uncharacterized membrane protein YkgB